MTVTPGTTAEFSRKLRLDRLAGGEVERKLEADESERRALAERFGLLAVESLTGELRVSRRTDSPLVRVEGELAADVRRTCVVTLAPFTAHVAETFVQLFTLDASPETSGEVFVAVEEDDPPEPVEGDSIDLGEVLAEQLALALDPHPRAPGVEFAGASFGATNGSAGDADETEDEEAENPFAVLKRLKREG